MPSAAGENASPDCHPGRGVQENARFSGLTVSLRARVQVMEDTTRREVAGGGHLGPSLVDSS